MAKKYWKDSGEIEPLSGSVQDLNNDKEFNEELPTFNAFTQDISLGESDRRGFLKMMGFGLGAASLAASCKMPVRKSIPYAIKPEEITPGIANYYASSYTTGGDYVSVLVKTREGRPIMIEGNNESSISGGGVSTKVFGSLLNLYDEARIKNPLKNGEDSTWENVDKEIGDELAKISASGKKIVVLSQSVHSPATKAAIAKFIEKYPGAEHVTHDTISYSGMIEANEASFGQKMIPHYHFDKAKLIVSIGADFLNTWLSPEEFSAGYAKNRDLTNGESDMNRHIQIESIPSVSGMNADLRIPVSVAEEELAVTLLYKIISGNGNKAGSYSNKKIEDVARELVRASGKSIVISGSNNKAVQMMVNAINDKLQNYGATIDANDACHMRQGVDANYATMIGEMKAGQVGAILVHSGNPSAGVMATEFNTALSKVDLKVSFASRVNETSELSTYVCPDNHFLESWNDAMPYNNTYATIQPTIAPLYDTRQVQQTLLNWAGEEKEYLDFIKENAESELASRQSKYSSFDSFWASVVHDGEIALNPEGSASPAISIDENEVQKVIKTASAMGDLQIKFYESAQIGDGEYADNPWMQEVPDPVTKICWDNYIVANKRWIVDNGYAFNDAGDAYNTKNREYYFLDLEINGKTLSLPLVELPGTPYGSLGVAMGYGKTATNNEYLKVGTNVYPYVSTAGSNISYRASVSSHSRGEGSDMLAITQQHHGLTHQTLGGEKTRLIVKETTLDEYKENNEAGNTINGWGRKEWLAHHLKSPYPGHDDQLNQGHRWGMVIDLNTCTGCAACVAACTAENNVAIVGKEEVRRAHEMHWLRIDKYYTGDDENPEVVFQPMLCQHCDNAPCENVCPVSATNHSTEGLNQMAYNRCFGTRYCANNCPYKVRRFNWFDYQSADSFDKTWLPAGNETDKVGMTTPTARMVLNPDVTIRSRGVMEKCSFCVQRIQMGKLDAKKEGRKLKDGEIVTACQSACGTGAITFGDVNDPESKVHKLMADDRAFGVIEEIHTLPSVNYLTKVRNKKKNDLA